MIRKLLLVAAAIAMPVSVVAVTGVAASAKTPAPPDPAVTCTVSGTVNFAPPGISKNGAVSASKVSTTTTSATTFGGAGCSGGSGPNTINSKSTKCDKHTAGMPSSNPACTPGNYGYGSWANFVSGGTTSIQKALKKLNFTIGAIAYQTKTTGASEILPGATNPCGNNEVGFQIVGTVKAPKNDKGQTSTLNACLGNITGTGLNPGDNFLAAAVDQVGTVATAAIDPAFSTVHVG
jgi:hypothetical protein